jgi:hypothetical protein
MPVFKKVEGESVELFVGATLSVYSTSIQVMSDVWDMTTAARVVTPEGVVKELVGVYATADASPEVKAAAARAESALRTADALARRAKEAAKVVTEVDKGSEVEVFKKRAKGYGKKGVVFWIGEGAYGTRAGMNVIGESDVFWTAITNLRVTTPDLDKVEAAEEAAFEAEVAAAAAFEARQALAKAAADAADATLRAKVAVAADETPAPSAEEASVLADERAYAAAARKAA